MAKFNGKTALIERPAADVYARLADLAGYQKYIDALPDDLKARIGDVRFTPDAIVITAQPVGEIVLRATRREEPSLLVFEAENSPVPLSVAVNLAENGGATDLTPVITVDIPPMLQPFVAPKLQEAADKMGDMLASLFKA